MRTCAISFTDILTDVGGFGEFDEFKVTYVTFDVKGYYVLIT